MAKCTVCRSKKSDFPVQVMLSSYNLRLCRQHFVEWLEDRVSRTVKKYAMFGHRDKILVAVSGGKDSLGLWFLLHRLGYEVDGLYIDLGLGEYSAQSRGYAQRLADQMGRRFFVVSMAEEFAPIGEMKAWTRKPACSICGTVKRYYMNRLAREGGYTVLATGHNLDDEVAVLWHNVLHWNVEYLAKQFPVLPADGPFLKKVKPLCRISEKESALYTIFQGIAYVKQECPYSAGASSLENKRFLQMLEESRPGSKITFYTGFLKEMVPLLRSRVVGNGEMAVCRLCGEPTITEVCLLCQLKQKMGKSG